MAVVCKICGKVASGEHTVVPATGHTPKAAIRENEHAASCDTAGSYDLVVYCDVCGAAYVKVFLIKEDAYTPLCESIQKTVE